MIFIGSDGERNYVPHLTWDLELFDIYWVIWREELCTSSDRQLENIFPLSSDRHMATQDPPSHLNFGAFRYCAARTVSLPGKQ